MNYNKKIDQYSNEEIIKICKNSKSMAGAARILEVDYKALKKKAIELNCFYPNQSGKGTKKEVRNRKCKLTCDISFFKNLTPYSAYWLGFIAADGCITGKGRNSERFVFCLKAEDKYIVQKLAEELKFTGEVKDYYHTAKNKKYLCSSITLYFKDLCDLLKQYGIVPRKSYQDNHFLSYIPNDLKKYWVFGFFDGDGSVTSSLDNIDFLGSQKDLQDIIDIFDFNKKRYYPHKNSKILYCLDLQNEEDRYKFAKEYVEFGSQYQTLSRKFNLLKQIVDYHPYFLEKRANKICLNKSEKDFREKTPPNFCPLCGRPIKKESSHCEECSHFLQRKVTDRPTRERLKELIRTTSFLKIGESYGVCDNTIRKWCIGYNLPFKKKEIKQYSDEEWFSI